LAHFSWIHPSTPACASFSTKGFSAAAVEALRPQVEAIVDQMLKPLQHGSEVELNE
jgi:cytochrome P450